MTALKKYPKKNQKFHQVVEKKTASMKSFKKKYHKKKTVKQ